MTTVKLCVGVVGTEYLRTFIAQEISIDLLRYAGVILDSFLLRHNVIMSRSVSACLICTQFEL